MFQKSFVVLAYPRTGSTLIIGNINDYFQTDALQTHDPYFVPQHENYTCIITKRKNVFDTICSHLVMNRTHESAAYTNKHIEPFRVSNDEMTGYLLGLYSFYRQRDLSFYENVIEIDFDQLITDPYYLFAQFNLVEKTKYNIQKSPYRYQELIINIDELWSIYQSISPTQ